MASKSRLAEYDSLSVAEKILRLQDLWDELAGDPTQVVVTEAQKAELDDRLADLETVPASGSAWSQARERIRKSRR